MDNKKALNSIGYNHIGGEIKKLLTILLLSIGFGAVITVPDDYITIQEGIDAAMDGDIVVVYPDLYEENILIDKSITLTSLALFDTTTNTIIESLGDDWIEYSDIFFKWEVIDDNINSTIIDGSGELKSTITIAADEDLCIEPIILGFTIQDGSGTLMDRFYENGSVTIQQYMGGGILSYLANPILHYNKIQNNGGLQDVIKSGSGIYPASSSDDIDFIDRNTQRNRDCGNTVFDFTHNFFVNNYSSLGRHIGNRYFDGEFNLSGGVFDKWNCQNPEYQTKIWVNIDKIEDLTAEDYQSNSCLRSEVTYVDPIGGNDDLNTGSIDSPFLTITKALASVIVLFTTDKDEALSASVNVKSPAIVVLEFVEFVPPIIVSIVSTPPSSVHATPNVIVPLSLSEVTVDASVFISPKF